MKSKIKLKIDVAKEVKHQSREIFKGMKKGIVIQSKKDKPIKHKKKWREEW